MDSYLRVVLGESEVRGRLADALAFDVDSTDDRSVFRPQIVQKAHAASADRGIFRRRLARFARKQLELRFARGPGRMMIRNRVSENAIKPRLDAIIGPKPIELLRRAHECLLKKIFRVCSGPHALFDEREKFGTTVSQHHEELPRKGAPRSRQDLRSNRRRAPRERVHSPTFSSPWRTRTKPGTGNRDRTCTRARSSIRRSSVSGYRTCRKARSSCKRMTLLRSS